MLTRIATLVIACVVTVSCASSAPKRAPSAVLASSPDTYYFDCDTPEGRFSQSSFPSTARELAVSGNLTVVLTRDDPKWIPSARVILVGEDNKLVAALLFDVDKQAPDSLRVSVGAPRTTPRALGVTTWREHKIIQFAVRLSPAGEFGVSVAGGPVQSLKLDDSSARRISFVCSTGQFKFSDVRFGIP